MSQTLPNPPNTCWDLTRTKQGEKKGYTPFLPESKCAVSVRGHKPVCEKTYFISFKWTREGVHLRKISD